MQVAPPALCPGHSLRGLLQSLHRPPTRRQCHGTMVFQRRAACSQQQPLPGRQHSKHHWQHQLPRRICSAAGEPQQQVAGTAADKCAVVEHLLLLRTHPGVGPDAAEDMLDSLWSLQYMVPGMLCAAAGPVVQPHGPKSAAGSPAPHSHLVHFRLASQQAHEAFMAHPLLAKHVAAAAQPLCASVEQLSFQAWLPRDLEALFKRGDQLETGWLQLLLLGPGPSSPADAPAFTARLAQLAESTGAGGAQATHGLITMPPQGQATAEARPQQALMVHFGSQQDLEQFWQTPACQALAAEDKRLPVQLAVSLAVSISPSDESNSTSF